MFRIGRECIYRYRGKGWGRYLDWRLYRYIEGMSMNRCVEKGSGRKGMKELGSIYIARKGYIT